MSIIRIHPLRVPKHLRGDYQGRIFKAVIAPAVIIPSTAGRWQGDVRQLYSAIDLSDGRLRPYPYWNSSDPEGETALLEPGTGIVRRSIFRGKDLAFGMDEGLLFCLHPDDAAPFLPLALTAIEALIMAASFHFAWYHYNKAKDHPDFSSRLVPFPTRQQWNQAKAGLVEKGLLTETGKVTEIGWTYRGSPL